MKKVFFGLFVLLSGCLFAKEVTVSISPQKYFVEKIAADKVNVNVMVKPGSSPAIYEPKTSQMKKLAKSSAYFSIGVPFENAWLERFKSANKNMLIVDTSKGIQKIEMEAHKHHDEDGHDKHKEEHHNEAEHEGHEHSGSDPHIWLDPILVKIQVKNIYESLVKIDAVNKEFYKKNLDNFLKELDEFDHEIHETLEKYEDKAFMIFHPSFGYFAKRYHLEQIAIEIEGKEPKPRQLIELVKEAKKHDIKIVFVAPQFSQKGAKTISNSINGNVSFIDPLAENWDINLLKVANEIAKSYK